MTAIYFFIHLLLEILDIENYINNIKFSMREVLVDDTTKMVGFR